MIERPQGGERAVLIHINFPAGQMQEDLTEFKDLASSAGADIVAVVTGARQSPEPKYFVGTGKADEIRAVVATHKADIAIFNHALSPAQERNLERLLQCRVIDRTGLILDIFAQRARSFEGKLQVELALLKHMSTRLVRGWTHLERQRGGIGLRGPGETQLETDRRLLRTRIKYITQRLSKVRKQREQGRRARHRASVPTIALVGYTNAGKSTLFNRLTGGEVYVANRLFATLDPTLRRIDLPEVGQVIVADTVGFIRHLPHDLVDAFHATLEEITEADLLLHVIDTHDERHDANQLQVNDVLATIGALDVPQLLVYNKIDLCPGVAPSSVRDEQGMIKKVFVSAVSDLGMTELKAAIATRLGHDLVQRTLLLTPEDAKIRAKLYQLGAILSEQLLDNGSFQVTIRMPRTQLEKMFK